MCRTVFDDWVVQTRSFDDWYVDTYPVMLAGLVVFAGNVDLAEDAAAESFSRALER